jgi:hypothetical protein
MIVAQIISPLLSIFTYDTDFKALHKFTAPNNWSGPAHLTDPEADGIYSINLTGLAI